MVFHGHLDVVPGRQEQYEPRVDGDKLFGHYVTLGFPNQDGDLVIDGSYVITGGTGRLKGAMSVP